MVIPTPGSTRKLNPLSLRCSRLFTLTALSTLTCLSLTIMLIWVSQSWRNRLNKSGAKADDSATTTIAFPAVHSFWKMEKNPMIVRSWQKIARSVIPSIMTNPQDRGRQSISAASAPKRASGVSPGRASRSTGRTVYYPGSTRTHPYPWSPSLG